MTAIHKHDGKGRPCDPETLTVVKYRNGEVSPCALPARSRQWSSHLGSPAEWNIIAWREGRAEEVCVT